MGWITIESAKDVLDRFLNPEKPFQKRLTESGFSLSRSEDTHYVHSGDLQEDGFCRAVREEAATLLDMATPPSDGQEQRKYLDDMAKTMGTRDLNEFAVALTKRLRERYDWMSVGEITILDFNNPEVFNYINGYSVEMDRYDICLRAGPKVQEAMKLEERGDARRSLRNLAVFLSNLSEAERNHTLIGIPNAIEVDEHKLTTYTGLIHSVTKLENLT